MESPTISNKKKSCQLEFRTRGPDLIPFNLLGDPAALQALDLLDFSPLQQLAALGKAIFLENDEPFPVHPYFPTIQLRILSQGASSCLESDFYVTIDPDRRSSIHKLDY